MPSENLQEMTTLRVPDDIEPCRIDIYLVQQGVGLSRSQIQKLIRSRNIRVVDKGTKPNFILRGGETIEIKFPINEPRLLLPENIPIDIIYEDEHLLVVNKPAGMVTHPARGNWSGTLINAVLYHTKRLPRIGGDFRPGVVHRLDKDTSGLLVIAKRECIHVKLSDMIARRKVSRKYLAILWGNLPQDSVVIEAPIGRSPVNPIKRIVIEGGKYAKTRFSSIRRFEYLELVSVKLFTGRTHQIRIHAEHIGHPVLGDVGYGGAKSHIGGISPKYRVHAGQILKMAPHQILHAWKLSFEHPVSGENVTFVANPPDDFAAIIDELGNEKLESLLKQDKNNTP